MSPTKRDHTVREPEASAPIANISRNACQICGETNDLNFWLGCGYKNNKTKKMIVPAGYTNGVLGFTIRLRLHFQRCHSTANVMVKPNAPKVKVASKNNNVIYVIRCK